MRLTQYDLAEMLAMSLPTLQRNLHRLEKANLIELGYRRIRIVDVIKLENLVTGDS